MDTKAVLSALDSDLRRMILQSLASRPLNAKEVIENLRKEHFKINYRETVYRALEKLVNADLLDKFYDREKGLVYKLKTDCIIINLADGTISECQKR